MYDKLIDIFIDNCNNIFIDKELNKIKKLDMGYIEVDGGITAFSILVHCFENIDIFDDIQKNNILNFVNQMTYE